MPHGRWILSRGGPQLPSVGNCGSARQLPKSTSTYDPACNTLNDRSTSYTYDSEGRPQTVGSNSIVYDAFNRMVEFNNGSTHTQMLFDPQGTLLGQMRGQSLSWYLVPLAGGLQALYGAGGLDHYRHVDWLGSSRLQLTISGGLYSSRAFAPFGETYVEVGVPDRSFTGNIQDLVQGVTGVYDFLMRQHAGSQGRWLVPDPAGMAAVDLTNPQTWNRYAYVGNNPLSYIDPLGLDCVTLDNGTVGDTGTGSPCTGMTQGNGDPDVTSSADAPSWWTFVIQGLPQYPYCAETGACSPCPPGGGCSTRIPSGPTISRQPQTQTQSNQQAGQCKPGQRCTQAYNDCMQRIWWKGVATGAGEAVGGVPDEVKELVHTISVNKAGLGAMAAGTAGSYFALSNAGAVTVGSLVSEVAIPALGVFYVGWRTIEGVQAFKTYMDQNVGQCNPL